MRSDSSKALLNRRSHALENEETGGCAGVEDADDARREVDATAELNARDEARAKRKAKQRGERARKIRERNER